MNEISRDFNLLSIRESTIGHRLTSALQLIAAADERTACSFENMASMYKSAYSLSNSLFTRSPPLTSKLNASKNLLKRPASHFTYVADPIDVSGGKTVLVRLTYEFTVEVKSLYSSSSALFRLNYCARLPLMYRASIYKDEPLSSHQQGT